MTKEELDISLGILFINMNSLNIIDYLQLE